MRKLSLLLLVTMAVIGAVLVFGKTSLSPYHKDVSYAFAKKVAAHYANVRWDHAHIGQGQLYYAPDGTPEVYFFVAFKEGILGRSEAELLNEVAAFRNRRIRIQKALEDVPETQEAMVKNLWSQMCGADKYATVVVGAHEEREPFIASYNGLPPHIFLREDAIETRRRQIQGKHPGEPKYIWQPPLFVQYCI